MDRNEPEEDARQIAGEPLAELPAGILTPGIDRFRPSFYGCPIHHGCDEQIFGADEQDSGRGQSDQDVFGPDAMMQSGECRMLSFSNSALPTAPAVQGLGPFPKGWGLFRRPARHSLRDYKREIKGGPSWSCAEGGTTLVRLTGPAEDEIVARMKRELESGSGGGQQRPMDRQSYVLCHQRKRPKPICGISSHAGRRCGTPASSNPINASITAWSMAGRCQSRTQTKCPLWGAKRKSARDCLRPF